MNAHAFNLVCESLATIDEAREKLDGSQKKELDIISTDLDRFVQKHGYELLEKTEAM